MSAHPTLEQTTSLHAGAVSISIAAPAETIYDVLADVPRMAELSPECERCEWADEPPLAAVGVRFIGRNAAHGQTWEMPCEIIAADRGRRFAFETGPAGHKITRWSFDLEPGGFGTTRVTESFALLELTPQLARADAEAQSARARELEDGIRQTLVRLKAVIEGHLERARPHVVTGAEEGEAFEFGDAIMTVKARGGDRSATIIEWVSPPGGSAPLHVHHDADDDFYILEGRVSLWCGGETFVAGAGDYVRLPRGVPHSVRVDGDQPLRALMVHAHERFADLLEAVGRPVGRSVEAFDYDRFPALALRFGQEILGPSPFDLGTSSRNPGA